MNALKPSLAAVLLGAFSLTAQAEDKVTLEGATVGEWTMDYTAAVALAKDEKLPLLLNFTGSDWCGWCKLMDENVFAKKEWKDFAAKNVLLVTLDFPRDETIVPEKYADRNKELQEKFGVRGYPTYIILDSDGETKLGQLGAGRDKTPESFINEFKTVVRMSDAAIEEYVKANPDKADDYKAAIQEIKDAKKALTDWVATGPQRNEENNKLYAEFLERIKAAEEALGKF